jgi:hypothetical protein
VADVDRLLLYPETMLAAPSSPPGDGGRSRWWVTLGLLAGIRVAVPLLTLALSGHQLPGLPAYRYQPLNGDSYVYYASAREFIASLLRVDPVLVLVSVMVLAGAVFVGVRLWRGEPRRPALAILLPASAVGLTLTLPVHEMQIKGGGTIGWPLLWSIPMAPIRLVGLGPGPNVAFGLGLSLSLGAIAGIVVATAYLGLYATGSRSVGLVASALFTAWPLVIGQAAGESAWENGQWNVDVGLHLYTEPVSTFLVVTSVVLLLRPVAGEAGFAVAGLAIGYSTVTRLTNGLIGIPLAALVAWRHGLRRAIPYVLGAVLWLPVIAVFWPKGYIGMFDGKAPPSFHPWGLSYASDAWRHSLVFTPRLLILLAPLFVVGCVVLRDRWVLAVVMTPVVVTATLYSFYYVTAIHPRFLYVTLPFVLVLEAAGGAAVVTAIGRRLQRPANVHVL